LSFGGERLYLEGDTSLFNNDELLTQHVIAHSLYTFKSEKDAIGSAHRQVVSLMVSRGLSHDNFDKLDVL